MQIIFLYGTKCLWLAQYVNKFLGWLKKFGPAQKILEPVKGQGIRLFLANLGGFRIDNLCLSLFVFSRRIMTTMVGVIVEINNEAFVSWILPLIHVQADDES